MQLPDPIFAARAPAGRIDGAAIAAVTDLYREMLPPGGAILDVMSGWISHLPPEAPFRRVVGVGVDRRALAENPFLDEWRAQDLNRDPVLPFANGEFDGATLCGAIQYLARPGEVIREVGARLKAGGAADRHLLEPMSRDQGDRLLVPARRGRASLSDRAAFRRGRQLGRHPMSRPNARPAAVNRSTR